MITPQSYLAYTPRGAGLLCAVIYIEKDRDVYGWWTGYKEARFPSAFFKLESFFSTGDPTFFASDGFDLYAGWKFNYSSSVPELDRPVPIEEDMCHELDRLQGAFANEWLFFPDDDEASGEIAAYREHDLPVQGVNIKYQKLNKLDKHDVVWIYMSPDLNMDIIEYMQRRWPLDYGKD